MSNVPGALSERTTSLATVNLVPGRLLSLRETRTEGLAFEIFQKKINEWLIVRPLLRWSDSNKQNLAKLLAGEVRELLAELETAKNRTDFKEVYKEAVDVIFFCLGYLAGNSFEADFDKVRRQMDGWDDSQTTFAYLLALASQVDGTNPVVVIERVLTVWSSAVTKFEYWFEVGPILEQVLAKNSGNYPKKYFEVTGLSPDEYDQAFNHRVRCLRTIRHVLEKVRPGDPKMRLEDHRPYAALIINHRSTNSFYELCQGLADHYHLLLSLVMSGELRSHRMVLGVLQPGQELDVGSDLVSPIGPRSNAIQ